MLLRLEPGSPQPVYRQIADAVAAQIEDGSIPSGARLPAARLLAGTLEVNMHTVLRAYDHLEDLGLVDKRRGRGGVIVSPPLGVEEMASRLVEAARRQGLKRSELVRMVEESW